MNSISATQIKAARAILGWSQDNLARAADLSLTTIRSLEAGHNSPRSSNDVRISLEKAGIEFLEDEGVKRQADKITVYKGIDSCDSFFDDIRQTVKEKGGDLFVMIKSQNMITQSSGL